MMLEEMKAQEKNGTWEVVGLPGGQQTIGSKWAMQRYKTQLVARVFIQSYRVYYFETFSPVAKLNLVSVILSIVVSF